MEQKEISLKQTHTHMLEDHLFIIYIKHFLKHAKAILQNTTFFSFLYLYKATSFAS